MKKYNKVEERKFEIDVMLNQSSDIATSTRETRALVAKMALKGMPEMFEAQIEKAKGGDTNAFIAVWAHAFGKPGLMPGEVGEQQPILFMPSALIEKYTLQSVNNVSKNDTIRDIESEKM